MTYNIIVLFCIVFHCKIEYNYNKAELNLVIPGLTIIVAFRSLLI